MLCLLIEGGGDGLQGHFFCAAAPGSPLNRAGGKKLLKIAFIVS